MIAEGNTVAALEFSPDAPRVCGSRGLPSAVYVIDSIFDSSHQYATGELIPVNGVYRCLHGSRDTSEVTLLHGERFPLCRSCGDQLRFQLLASTPAPAEEQTSSPIVVYEVPHPEPISFDMKAPDGEDSLPFHNPLSSNSHPKARMSRVRITRGKFYADIIRDRHDPGLWLYVVQRVGSMDILAMGSCHSEMMASETATHAMDRLADVQRDSSSAVAS